MLRHALSVLLAGLMMPVAFARADEETLPPSMGPLDPPPVVQPHKTYFAGVGFFLHNLGKYSTDPSGSTAFVSSAFPELVFTGRFPFQDGWGISPLLAFTPFSHQSPDGGETTRIIRLEGRMTKLLGPVDLQAGLGLLLFRVSGAGGTIDLANGNSTTTFGLPSDSSTSDLFYWSFGTSVEIQRLLRWETTVLMTAPLTTRRAVDFSTQISIGVF